MWPWLLIELTNGDAAPVSTATSLQVTNLASAGLSANSVSSSGLTANGLTSSGLQVDDLESV